jgi:hypothetical protein
MDDRLIDRIANSNPVLETVFEKGFQTPAGWRSYLDDNLPGGAFGTLTKLSTLSPAQAFQALYVACWIYRPVEKGSYMIPLLSVHAPLVGQAMEKLPSRWSSHLSETNPHSAGAGYAFLKGYSELLVQLEVDPGTKAPYLFLKTEGHGAMSFAHVASFIAKTFGGEGLTQD